MIIEYIFFGCLILATGYVFFKMIFYNDATHSPATTDDIFTPRETET